MEGLPVHVIIGTTVIAIPLIVIHHTFIMDGTVPSSMFVGIGYATMCLVVTLGVGVGAVLVVMGTGATPEAILQGRALEVLVVRVDLLALAAADGVREWVVVGAVAGGGFVMELGHVYDA